MQIVNDSGVRQTDPCPSHSLLQVTVFCWSMQNKVAALCGQLIVKVTLMILVNMRQSEEFRACFEAKIKSDLQYEYIHCHLWARWKFKEFPLVPGILSYWNSCPGMEAEKLFLHTCLPPAPVLKHLRWRQPMIPVNHCMLIRWLLEKLICLPRMTYLET